MERTLTCFIFLRALSGFCEGAGVLPTDPMNGCLGESKMFQTSLDPTTTPFLSVGWSLGADIPIITSLLDKNLTVPEYEGRITLFRSTGSLELRNLKLNESGEYRVSILPAGDFQKTGSIRLNVHEKVSVTVNPQSVDLVEFNRSVHLSCSSSGSSPSFLWMNSSSEVTASDRVQISSSSRGSNMTIVNVTRYDQGSYKCRPLCPDTNDLPEVNITVSFGPENVEISNGSDILTCSAESRPPAELTWFLNGELVSTGPELRVTNQTGTYTCHAFNRKTFRNLTSQPVVITVQEPVPPSGLSGGAIAGIVIACLVAVFAVVVVLYVLLYRGKVETMF